MHATYAVRGRWNAAFLILWHMSQILDARFVAPPFASWEQLETQRPAHLGKCWIMAAVCLLHPELSGLVDEEDQAYITQGVGKHEESCLSRAAFNWRFCGNRRDQMVVMIFRPTGAAISYPNISAEDELMVDSKHVAVYSALFGNYDTLHEAVPQSITSDFWMFTDMQPEESNGWIIVDSPANFSSPRLSAKWFKVFPDRIPQLEQEAYDYIIWIDASLRITSPDFVQYMIDQAGDTVAMFVHPWRDCVYSEAEDSARMLKYRDQPIAEQVDHYRYALGWPEHAGLMACTVLCWNRRYLNAQFNQAWWDEITRWTTQDQLSFPVVAARHGLKVVGCSADLMYNPFFEVDNGHRRHEYSKV